MTLLLLRADGKLARNASGGLVIQGAAATSATPASVSGLSSWWDASTLPSAGRSIASLADKAGSTALTANASAAAQWIPRLAGGKGGVGLEVTQQQGYSLQAWAPTLHPLLDLDLTMTASVTFGSGGALTLDLVWTRPNLRQQLANSNSYPGMSGTFVGGTSPLLTIAGTTVLGMTNTGAGDNLLMWPNGTPTTLSTSIEPRHTHSLRLRGSHAAGWDVFLDGTKLTSSPVASQLASSPTTATVQMLGAGSGTSAQCWFHEAFCYPRALTNVECATLEGYLARWTRGVRKAAMMLPTGQSNMGYMSNSDNQFRNLCRGITYLTGLASFTMLQQGSGANLTVVGGHGLYGDNTNYLNASISSTPSTVQLGTTGPGTAMQGLIQSLPAYLQQDLCGLFALYSENDAGLSWGQQDQFAGLVRRFNQIARTFPQYGPTRDQTNWLLAWNSDIPFSGAAGHAAHKAAINEVVVDSTQNCLLWLLNGTGAIQRGGTFNASTGVNSGGDGLHIDDSVDSPRFALYGTEPLARRLAAIGRAENTIPVGLPVTGGPKVSTVHWEGATITGNAATPSALLTVQHDVGNDLRVPLLAVGGLGWVLLDGAVPGSSPIIKATSCVRVSSTTLRVVFASAPTSALASVLLYYIYVDDSAVRANNPGSPGRGNMVTDNYSDTTAVPAVSGFDLGTDLGSQFRVDRPLAAFPLGVPLG